MSDSSPLIEVFADSEPIDDKTRLHCRIFKSHAYQHLEVWVDDKLVWEAP
jgi:hypothetical protein